MAIIANKTVSKKFELPTEGVPIQAVIAEIRDLGMVKTVWQGQVKEQHKVLFRYQLSELDSNKEPKRSYERFTLSLHEKAGLRKRLKQIYGKEPEASVDLEKCVGTNVNLIFSYSTDKNDSTKIYANIEAVLRLPANTPKLEIVKIEAPKTATVAAATPVGTGARPVTAEDPITSEDCPF